MEKLHSDLKSITVDFTGQIDDLTRYVSQQFMKKKQADFKKKQAKEKKQITETEQTEARKLELEEKENYSNLVKVSQIMNDFGKIERLEKDFQTLSNINEKNENQIRQNELTDHEAI